MTTGDLCHRYRHEFLPRPSPYNICSRSLDDIRFSSSTCSLHSDFSQPRRYSHSLREQLRNMWDDAWGTADVRVHRCRNEYEYGIQPVQRPPTKMKWPFVVVLVFRGSWIAWNCPIHSLVGLQSFLIWKFSVHCSVSKVEWWSRWVSSRHGQSTRSLCHIVVRL